MPTGVEVASACLYLASDESSAITGQNINVDCGVFLSNVITRLSVVIPAHLASVRFPERSSLRSMDYQ